MKTILFVCVHNAGRSVMAEAFFNADPPAGYVGISAGTHPTDAGPHPEVVETMRELGIDVSSHAGRMLTSEMVESAERVFTMGCSVDAEACPAILYLDVEDWGLDDPKGLPADAVRAIRDDIRGRVRELVAGL